MADISAEDEPSFLELLLAVQFAIRQLSNLGHGADSEQLALQLGKMRLDDSGQLRDSRGTICNIQNPQQQRGKRITADLLIDGTGSKLEVKKQGFGFLNRKFWGNIPNAVAALFLAVAERQPQDRDLARRVQLSAAITSNYWLTNLVSLHNHSPLALQCTLTVWALSHEQIWEGEIGL